MVVIGIKKQNYQLTPAQRTIIKEPVYKQQNNGMLSLPFYINLQTKLLYTGVNNSVHHRCESCQRRRAPFKCI